MGRGKYVCSIGEWEWIPGALKALKNLKKAGYTIIVITNQPGVARHQIKLTVLEEIHEKMKNDALNAGGRIDAIYFCPHDWDEGCSCRKPEPGLLFQAQKDFSVDLSRLTFIGDDDRDGAAAKAAGVEWLKVTEKKPILDVVTDYLSLNN
ncbi:MAG: HAD-IIIA family hydrolase, partial [Pseudomonadota bacterium]|nr:HAD-IIIA family hydrolase [Pseudomonadota bacterium]